MGCYLTKDSNNNLESEKKIRALRKQFSDTDKVIIVELKEASRLKVIEAKLFRANGPYFEISLKPTQTLIGEQSYKSSHRPPTDNPQWNPFEMFHFLILDRENQPNVKLLFTAWNFNSTPQPEELGVGVLDLKDVSETRVEKKISIYDEGNGTHVGDVDIFYSMMGAKEAASMEDQIYYEYQSWKPVIEWGSTDEHFMPSDKGKWSDATQSVWGVSLESVAGKIDESSQRIVKNWHSLGNKNDVEGWSYATNFNYLDWWPEKKSGMFVRRRMWKRIVCEVMRPSMLGNPSFPNPLYKPKSDGAKSIPASANLEEQRSSSAGAPKSTKSSTSSKGVDGVVPGF
jgi:hypothetical protein